MEERDGRRFGFPDAVPAPLRVLRCGREDADGVPRRTAALHLKGFPRPGHSAPSAALQTRNSAETRALILTPGPNRDTFTIQDSIPI